MIQITEKDDNTFTFSLSTENNIVLLQGADFISREEIQQTLNEIVSSLQDQKIFERRTTNTGKFLFHLKNLKGKIIGTSQLYNSEAGMENGIKNFKNSIAIHSKL